VQKQTQNREKQKPVSARQPEILKNIPFIQKRGTENFNRTKLRQPTALANKGKKHSETKCAAGKKISLFPFFESRVFIEN